MVARPVLVGHFCCNREALICRVGRLLTGNRHMTRKGYATRSIFQNANMSFIMTSNFSEFDLQPQLVQTIADLGYVVPTPIQSTVIPAMLSGQDVIGQSQTGSGKTAAFSLPILHNLQTGQRQVQCLVVTPTRELAIQVADAMSTYGRQTGVRVLAVYGGQPYDQQIDRKSVV